jgi:hypothetical protein
VVRVTRKLRGFPQLGVAPPVSSPPLTSPNLTATLLLQDDGNIEYKGLFHASLRPYGREKWG